MTLPIFWLESEDFAPDLQADAATESGPEAEEETDYWNNMIFPI